MGEIQKGVILSISGTKASVQSTTADSTSTMPITIPWYLRGSMGALEKGTEVAYALFEDATGVILSRMDGDWNGVMDDDVTCNSVTAQTITSQGVNLSSHTHSGVKSGADNTGSPN